MAKKSSGSGYRGHPKDWPKPASARDAYNGKGGAGVAHKGKDSAGGMGLTGRPIGVFGPATSPVNGPPLKTN
jgi:hypothetical protein